jgi:hypothetical protein
MKILVYLENQVIKMAKYRCNSCGAELDTEVAARQLGYSSGAKTSFIVSKCGNCGSSDIKRVD